MNLSLNWLKRYLKLDLPIDEISEILTTIGLEVEGVEEVEMIPGGLKGIKIGHVLTREKHPDADKLSVTTVDIGEKEPLHIVCGAPNVDAGQKVLVATIGTTMYNADEPWKIKKGKIRGQLSEGMLCGADEVGLGTDTSGIMVLPEEATVGLDAAEHFNVESDIVFDIGLTPNRSDATSVIGVARDVYAYLTVNKDYDYGVKEPSLSAFNVPHESYVVDVEIQDPIACPRYSGVTLTGVKVKESPKWIKDALTAIGIKSINNVVDITNFVLHEYGQPLHAFDADTIIDRKVIVRKAEQDEKFVTLDGDERSLNSQDIVICNGSNQPMCLGGVYGGLTSGVKDSTVNVFLESAHFNAGTIRKTSTRHLLRTEAAKVYEKGSDPNITIDALKRAAILLVEHADATIASEIVDKYPTKIEPVEVTVKYKKISDYIGTELSKDEVHDILRAMKMELLPVDDATLKVQVPTNKADVTRDVDIIEEVLRIYGFNKVPIPTSISSTIQFQTYPSKRKVKETVANHLAAQGYHEMMGLSLIESRLYDNFDIDKESFVYINNTSNIHLDIMRPEMLFSGLLSVQHNLNRQQKIINLFEFGKSYRKSGDDFKEEEFLTVFVCGKQSENDWINKNDKNVDFYNIKGSATSILNRLGVDSFQSSPIEEDDRFHYGIKLHRGPQVIGKYGSVSPKILKQFGIKNEVFYLEIGVELLVNMTRKVKNSVSEISKFPSVKRDLALVLDEKVKFEDIKNIAFKSEKKLLKDISLFDVYVNEEVLGKGKKSYAVSYTFEDVTKTLKDKDIEKVMKKLIDLYKKQLKADIRS